MMGIRKPGRSRIYFLFSAAMISIFLTVAAISTIGYDSLYELGNVSLLSLSIFIFPLLFFLLGLAAVYFSVKKIRDSGALLSS
jgi:CHASE3 domain sensor protein